MLTEHNNCLLCKQVPNQCEKNQLNIQLFVHHNNNMTCVNYKKKDLKRIMFKKNNYEISPKSIDYLEVWPT